MPGNDFNPEYSIAGGAIVPFIIGWLGDITSLKYGISFLYITFGYVLSVGLWAKPLVKNKTFEFVNKRTRLEN